MSHVKISQELYFKLLELAQDAEDQELQDELKDAYIKYENEPETKEHKPLDVPGGAEAFDIGDPEYDDSTNPDKPRPPKP